MLDFAVGDLSVLKNKTLEESVGKLPTLVYFYRGHLVPYLHELSRESIGHWIWHQSLRHRVNNYHDVDEVRKQICRLT